MKIYEITESKRTWMKDGVEMCSKECCGAPVTECTCGPGCKHCDCHKINECNSKEYEEITLEDKQDFHEEFGYLAYCEEGLFEAEYQGRTVKLNKPTRGDVKKFKVYVKNEKGNVIKVNFGHGGTSAKSKGEKTMKIRKSNPKARKSFRARHNCENPGPKTKARYWSCRKW